MNYIDKSTISVNILSCRRCGVHVFSLILGESIMKTSFVAKNRRFLKLCSDAARFCGLLLLFFVGIAAALPVFGVVSGAMEADVLKRWFGLQMCSHLLTLVSAGLLSLALAEFILYVIDGQGEPKWILRHADKIIYVYTIFVTVASVRVFAYVLRRPAPEGSGSGFSNLMPVFFTAISAVAHPLILIGIGITLRKILPIIRESKTLV
jgi:hypothetical protein